MIDWLSATVDVENYDENMAQVIEELEAKKTAARKFRSLHKNERLFIDFLGETFEVYPNGNANYAYILHNDKMELNISLGRSRSKNSYPIYVHFKSEFLWANGPENCWLWFLDRVGGFIGPVKDNKLNRVDLCCHTDRIEELDPAYFKGKFTKHVEYKEWRKLFTIEFGSRKSQKIFARIYNKTLEIKTSRKPWFKDVWLDAGLNPDRVTNIEFQLNRKFFTTLRLIEPGQTSNPLNLKQTR